MYPGEGSLGMRLGLWYVSLLVHASLGEPTSPEYKILQHVLSIDSMQISNWSWHRYYGLQNNLPSAIQLSSYRIHILLSDTPLAMGKKL